MIAILMAAGLGSRMAPLTEKTAKPLVKVHGKSMIETVIEGVYPRVSRIYVVVGYKKEQFAFLPEKYPRLSLIENEEFSTVNNISSIRAAREVMGTDDCFICEADLYVSDPSMFETPLFQSCYFGKFVAGHSDDWVFDQNRQGRITRVGKGGDDVYNMCGISWFRAADARVIRDAIDEAYTRPGTYENLFWDDIVDRSLSKLDLTVHPVTHEQIVEIDTVAELAAIDPDYRKYN